MARKPSVAAQSAPEIRPMTELRDRYNESAQATDVFRRVIVVRRLRPSQQSKIEGMMHDLAGSIEVTDEATGKKGHIPRATRHFIAAAVREIYDVDGVHKVYPFPNSRAELDAVFDYLDNEGVDAAGEALFTLMLKNPSQAETREEAKN